MLLRRHLAHRPSTQPVRALRRAAGARPAAPAGGDAGDYHAYAFATVRMVGSAFEVAASQAQWLLEDAAGPASAALMRIVEGCKALSFRLARRRAFEPEPALSTLGRGVGRGDGAARCRARLRRSSHRSGAPMLAWTASRHARCRRDGASTWMATSRGRCPRAGRPHARRRIGTARWRTGWPELDPRARPRHRGRRAGRRRGVAAGRTSRLRRGGLVVSHELRRRAGHARRGGGACAWTASRRSPRCTSTASACSTSDSMFAATRFRLGDA